MMPMELRNMESCGSHMRSTSLKKGDSGRRGTHSDGRHDDLVDGDPLGKRDKTGCVLSARGKRESVFEILVPATNDGT